MDVSSVRAEIKAWERSFKSQNARNPSVQDIKDNPAIAEKYRLYKRLSKLVIGDQPKEHADPTSTPPRRTAILAKSRAVEKTPPLAAFNPFSPVKSKAKRRDPTCKTTAANPFATPVKSKAKLPESPLNPFLHRVDAASTTTPVSNAPKTAVARARKRLRGDPVSPSPSKDKRRRVSSLFFADLEDSDEDEEEDAQEATSSFLGESPVRPPAGGKSFKLLFEEAVPMPADQQGKGSLLGSASQTDFKTRETSSSKRPNRDSLTGSKSDMQKRIFSGGSIFPSLPKDNLSAILGEDNRRTSQPKPGPSNPGPSKHPQPDPEKPLTIRRTSVKRVYSDNEANLGSPGPADHVPHQPPVLQLLRPSPPPGDTHASAYRGKGKDKAKAHAARKKAKLGEAEEADDEATDQDKIKVIDLLRCTRTPPTKSVAVDSTSFPEDPDSDGISSTPARSRAAHQRAEAQDEGGIYDIDLPENLHRVLVLDPSKPTSSKEESIVRGLLYGDPSGNYDAEVWGAGEDIRGAGEEGEDEWEGEGVPWEIGEL